jgi:DNA-binding Lrp family transcriptional regulator
LILNSRIPLSEIAKRIRRSKSFVKYRIDRLEKLNVIVRYVVAVKWNKVGFHAFRILAKGVDKIRVPKILGLRWYNEFYGGYEFLMLSYDMRNVQYLINYLRERGFETDIMIRSKVLIPFNFLGSMVEIFPSCNSGKVSVDRKWFWNFLTTFEKNLRQPVIKLAGKLNTDYHKLRETIKNFEKSVIRGYSIMINPKLLGYKKGIIYVSVKRNMEFLKAISKVKSKINYLEKLVGKYDYRLEIYYKHEWFLKNVVNTLEDTIREIFVIKIE